MTPTSDPGEVERLFELSTGEASALARLDDCVQQLRDVQAAKVMIAGLDSATLRELIARRQQRLATPEGDR